MKFGFGSLFNRNQSYSLACVCYVSSLFFLCLIVLTARLSSAIQSLNIYQVIFIKTLFLGIVLAPVAIRKIHTIKIQDIKYILITCICTAVDAIFINVVWSKIPVNDSVILMFAAPFFVIIASRMILKEAVSRGILLSMTISFTGTIMAFGGISASSKYEIYAMAITALTISAIGVVYLKQLTAKYDVSLLVFLRTLTILLVSCFFIGNVPNISQDAQTLQLTAALCVAYLAERYLSAKAYSLTQISRLQPLRFLTIAFSSLLSYLVLGEEITRSQFYAIAFIGIGLFIFHQENKSRLR